MGIQLAQMEGVYKSYDKVAALDGLDLEIRSGEVLALLGPNGAGKTTAISLMLGLLQPDAGQVQLFGESPHSLEARRKVGVMMQEVFLARELKVRELITVFSSYYPSSYSVDEVLALTNTTALANKHYARLSGGQMRQVQFAIALAGRPRLLFLDEPTVGLDVLSRQTMWTALRNCINRGCSILLTTHYLEEAEALADRVVMLAKGRVVSSGTVQEVTQLVATRNITCATAIPAEQVQALPGVTNTASNNGRLTISVRHAQVEEVLRQLLALDTKLTDLEVTRAGLEEAFLQLTKEPRQ